MSSFVGNEFQSIILRWKLVRAESKMEKQLKEQTESCTTQHPKDVYKYGNCDPRVSAHERWC